MGMRTFLLILHSPLRQAIDRYYYHHSPEQNTRTKRTKMPFSRRSQEEISDDNDEDEDIEYGIRRSRRGIAYHHRGSSSLTPAQFMDQDI